MWFYARKSIMGPIIGTIETVPWVLLSIHDQLWAMLILSLFVGGISAHAWITWSRAKETA